MADTLITNLANVASPTGAEEVAVNVPGTPDTDGKVVLSNLAAYVEGTLGLGSAALADTGDFATAAQGTDARPPTAHASSHVTGGSDAIQSATAAQDGLATATQITKLDGIEAAADVTDAGNVGTAIDGAAAITTITDADKLPVTQSGVLKSIAYSALKTLLDVLYQAKATILTTFGGLANSAGVLTNNGSGTLSYTGTSTGGNGAADDGKLILYSANGALGASGQLTIVGTTGTLWYGDANIHRDDGAGNTCTLSYPATTANLTLPVGTGTLIKTGDTGTVTSAMIVSAPALSAANMTSFPTLNQNTTGTAAGLSSFVGLPVEFSVALGDETTAATTGTKATWRVPCAMTVTSVRLECVTAPTGSVAIIDVKEAGTTIFSTKPQIAISATTSVGGAVPGTLSDTALADNAVMTFIIDQIGSTVAGAGYKVTIRGTRA